MRKGDIVKFIGSAENAFHVTYGYIYVVQDEFNGIVCVRDDNGDNKIFDKTRFMIVIESENNQ